MSGIILARPPAAAKRQQATGWLDRFGLVKYGLRFLCVSDIGIFNREGRRGGRDFQGIVVGNRHLGGITSLSFFFKETHVFLLTRAPITGPLVRLLFPFSGGAAPPTTSLHLDGLTPPSLPRKWCGPFYSLDEAFTKHDHHLCLACMSKETEVIITHGMDV